jgi:hypothetical protein
MTMTKKISIYQAGNTLVPVLATLESLGFRLWQEPRSTGRPFYHAENDEHSVFAHDSFALLGLIKMLEIRGENWLPTNEEIKRYLDV